MKYYFTVPIYYTNGAPHIGHAYTTMAADVLRRYKKLMGDEPSYTTGTDEHGVNVARSAEKSSRSPKEFVDAVARWDKLAIQPDHFIRPNSKTLSSVA